MFFLLKSVIVHTGEATNQGHYTLSFIDEHGAWLECDDTHTRKTNLPKKGYIFFYERDVALPFQSTLSNIVFSNNNEDLRHINKHTEDKLYQCNSCVKSFLTHNELINHTKTHTGGKSYQCSFVKKLFLINRIC